jgi:hypothetical protein
MVSARRELRAAEGAVSPWLASSGHVLARTLTVQKARCAQRKMASKFGILPMAERRPYREIDQTHH